MINLRKNHEKLRSAVVVSALISSALVGFGCDRGTPAAGTGIDKGDPAASAARIAEADALYEGREDMQKARVAVAALRQARTSDYGNYEAAWKLARAAFYVGDHTDVDSERSNMFREGTEAGKAAVQLQPSKPEGHFWLGA